MSPLDCTNKLTELEGEMKPNAYDRGRSGSLQRKAANENTLLSSAPDRGETENTPGCGGPFVVTVTEVVAANLLESRSIAVSVKVRVDRQGREFAAITKFIATDSSPDEKSYAPISCTMVPAANPLAALLPVVYATLTGVSAIACKLKEGSDTDHQTTAGAGKATAPSRTKLLLIIASPWDALDEVMATSGADAGSTVTVVDAVAWRVDSYTVTLNIDVVLSAAAATAEDITAVVGPNWNAQRGR